MNDFEINFRDRLFNEDNMYTRVKTMAQTENMSNTLAALTFMCEKHQGQFRKGYRYSAEQVKYINHPLMMACHAHAMGIRDDVIMAAILLHDVVEDTGTSLDELPVNDEIRQLVDLLTFKMLPGKTKAESKAAYFEAIAGSEKASVVKVIDRCNNVSTMAGCFSREKLIEYIAETEEYVIPLLRTIKNKYPEHSDIAFMVKYQIISLLESIKALL
ncbi:MAG: bifunctional (p)ppGpp synthetase/guanosine-3',5'-bis(diphosphate) 3'-pyrophosphohydrolase [Eubacterium sp.]|nr:bifunctional (p)ppGpp synthetase/guanosine-3',5'-bis(diphosphate) 3'-pyrophosphohydrolase [Eubacterium sp.]MBR0412251.1 bifunctional (p)ppGpp synthetase/guanosine-3',5'-bis(diphosphate) 3'-pyrophosphohydrolase [Eubacterium sp.]